MIFTHEQTQELLKTLRAYREWVQKAEYTADVKTPGILEGTQAIKKAEDFIADLDAAVAGEADNYIMRWAKEEELDNWEGLPIKRMFFKEDEKEDEGE